MFSKFWLFMGMFFLWIFVLWLLNLAFSVFKRFGMTMAQSTKKQNEWIDLNLFPQVHNSMGWNMLIQWYWLVQSLYLMVWGMLFQQYLVLLQDNSQSMLLDYLNNFMTICVVVSVVVSIVILLESSIYIILGIFSKNKNN